MAKFCIHRLVFSVLIYLVISSQVLAASNNNLLKETSYLEDQYGVFTIDQVKSKNFIPFSSMINRGYTDSVTWLRVVVVKPEPSEVLILRVRPYFLDEVQIYSEDDIIPGLNSITGDTIEFSHLPYLGKSLGFKIYPRKKYSTYYLRLKTTSSSILAVDALSFENLKNVEEKETLFFGIYLGVMIWVLGWAILSFVKTKDSILGTFFSYQFNLVLMALSYTGYLGRFLFSDFISRDWLTSNLVLLASLTGFMFHRSFIREFHLQKNIGIAMTIIFVFTILNFLSGNLFGFARALELNAYLILISILVFSAIVINLYLRDRKNNLGVISIYGLLNLVVALTLLPLVGLVKSTDLALHTSLTHGFMTGILMFVLMRDRSNKLLQKQRALETEALLVKQTLLNEQQVRQAQDAFLGMLSHELKSPLGVVRFGINNLKRKISGSLQADIGDNFIRLNSAIEDMDAVIDRCVEANRVEYGDLIINQRRVCISALIQELIDAKSDNRRLIFGGLDNTYFETDEQFIKIIVSNLLDNAIKYSKADTNTKIWCTSTDEYLEISFENFIDESRVIDPNQMFEKYYRDPESMRQRGTGLGLWLSKKLAGFLGGDLSFNQSGNIVKFMLVIRK